jgi:hypothetical protein
LEGEATREASCSQGCQHSCPLSTYPNQFHIDLGNELHLVFTLCLVDPCAQNSLCAQLLCQTSNLLSPMHGIVHAHHDDGGGDDANQTLPLEFCRQFSLCFRASCIQAMRRQIR